MRAVVYALSDMLYPYFKITLRSLLEHTEIDKIYVMIQGKSFPEELPDICEVIDISDQTIFDRKSPNYRSKYNIFSFMRMASSKLLPEDKVLSLGVDTVICDDIGELWDIDLTGYYAAAVPEYKGTWKPYGDTYYNADVMMLNLAHLRDGMDDRLINMINTQSRFYVEQDCMNELMGKQIIPLPARYNESFCCGRTDNPAIIHYAGFTHWWNPNYSGPDWRPADEPQERKDLVLRYL